MIDFWADLWIALLWISAGAFLVLNVYILVTSWRRLVGSHGTDDQRNSP